MHVIVVGGGIVGASAAYHLAVRNVTVTLVDRADTGQATAAGAGIVSPWSRDEHDLEAYTLGRESARHYRELAATLADDGDGDLGFRVVGGIALARDPGELAHQEATLRARRDDAPEIGDVALLDPAELGRAFPPARRDLVGLHHTGAGRIDGRQACATLRSAAQRRGAELRHGSAELDSSGERIEGVRVEGVALEADAVVVAAGAWTPPVCAPAGIDLPVTAQRGQIVHLELPGADTAPWPVVHAFARHYLLGFGGPRVVAGATREDGTGFDHRVTVAGLSQILERAVEVAPDLGEATVAQTRVGFRPMSSDGRPLLGPVPGAENVVVATGLGPRGLTVGPLVGAIAGDLAVGEAPRVPIEGFALTRA
ncbi:FAD-dependent oxidoreductase [Egibacter rhizosphaerae]|uniref:FAD-dependent oxidoreductase n=1 Tax=Egibacter rhizosphaerae TaxID=1670831 RepID=A0A411YHS3_9ACTN|nr:FAD-binding oxidoreductase [Egibacter rhizosphaerae]QBI20622.1 FAD-dependent oxidoreductase [Egibacter rhizosphaerae]